jgi:hypothetical protein
MNLNASPTREQLRELLANSDDRAGHHVLWVDGRGEVHLAEMSAGLAESALERSHPDMRLRYETFQKGNEYVGPEAAGDESWTAHLFESLLREWARAGREDRPRYIPLDD